MASYATGETIYDIIYSLDNNNTPVSGATFDIDVFKDGSINTGTTVNMTLQDAQAGIFSSSWSASSTGDYQIAYRNLSTSVIFLSDTYKIIPDDELGVQVFVGL